MPVYVYECDNCPATFTEVRPMADYDKPCSCPTCGTGAKKVITTSTIMTHALPDGTRRFDGIRKARELERLKQATKDPAEKKKITSELSKLAGK